MAGKTNTIVGLDIGTSKVTVLVADLVNDPEKGVRLSIAGIGTSQSSGLRKGVVINIEATVAAIAAAIQQAEAMAGRQITHVFASISGSHLKSFNSNGIVPIRDREVSRYDIEKVIEAAKAVAIPLDREILHVLPQEFIIDDQDGIREPLGISGVRLEARVHIVTGSVASAQNIVKCANRCGLTVSDLVLAPFAAARAVMSAEEQELGVCVLDIGGGTTDLIVFKNGAVRYSSVIPIGGNHIMNDVANVLRTPISAAEFLKCRHGSAVIKPEHAEETIDVPSTGGRQARSISRQALSEVIYPRVNEIFNLVVKDLIHAGCDDMLTGGVVLTGGTAKLADIGVAAEEVFQVPVRIGRVQNTLTGLTDLIDAPEYATVVGLVQYGSQIASIQGFSSKAGHVGNIAKRVGNWFRRNF